MLSDYMNSCGQYNSLSFLVVLKEEIRDGFGNLSEERFAYRGGEGRAGLQGAV